jgi:hypothetical protein
LSISPIKYSQHSYIIFLWSKFALFFNLKCKTRKLSTCTLFHITKTIINRGNLWKQIKMYVLIFFSAIMPIGDFLNISRSSEMTSKNLNQEGSEDCNRYSSCRLQNNTKLINNSALTKLLISSESRRTTIQSICRCCCGCRGRCCCAPCHCPRGYNR